MSNFVSPEWVNEHVNDIQVIFFDCRFSLADPQAGFKLYKKDHIKGAYFADLNNDLSRPLSTHGGRHPLPSVNILSQFFSNCGVDGEKIVVAYDDEAGAYASRLWWILKYLGHSKVFVMNCGYTHYKEKGYSISSKMPAEKSGNFTPNVQNTMKIDKDELLRKIKSGEDTIIDAREEGRYKGIFEPIDHKAGHIPTAVNIPWKSNYRSPGIWRSREELRTIYKSYADKKEKQIVYCGSGVTACINILAMDEAGIGNVSLYPGSWSDWISYEENEVETD
ncbi:sulfurtransferase [Fictibacillus barbaricus]|uniref:Thiosulfate/3-mercaptopyruvate sulfurtransferase n=1 Tax=Fictibacillus barbaricus TaxID=182136 RepID=A0ABU1TYM4_9BACL|nr:sulfurtransferase [Fictibacillus barbaricus]MDR7072286.1 thiosulfate/3-mercaptopyruvate sulfurtransferase [Fictibacillus barbaricus]